MIGIIDYGMGNLFSVSKALERLGASYFISDDLAELAKADGLILPGVGSFKDAMIRLKEMKLDRFIEEYVENGGFLLGICLGMQLLFDESEENGFSEGLSLLPGKIGRFSGIAADNTTYKVPHMGWNKLQYCREAAILEGCYEEHVYFVHSYYLQTDNQEVVIATANYYESVPAIVGKGRVFGMQFHPEKSSQLGMKLLKNYLQLVEKKVEA
ncbi:imidazole glycerol phosphate synthase subunit HisH [Bacillus sp. AGMB 02131]|uniref:Imidazole glycerol phosphate synthase subunit HisH n=1 Tax=Peribacillus faecalis TaxID=2772559 RepID=A0A927HBG2_9BACI|nr:imidazole glycerol phosphate synthase subunit HisH [Peribacillus faecalis]MBD3108562.1 imidazole glycerol phosphate synthase subunit HisH [Peribacillus faecalis]